MDDQTIAVIVFGCLMLGALAMFALERRAMARRRADGRDVDVAELILFGSKAGKGEVTVGKPRN